LATIPSLSDNTGLSSFV